MAFICFYLREREGESDDKVFLICEEKSSIFCRVTLVARKQYAYVYTYGPT